jgi:glutamate carboxypeptidase
VIAAEAHARIRTRGPELVERLAQLVATDTPSRDPDRLAAGSDLLAGWFGEVAEERERREYETGTHLVFGRGDGGLLLLCHYDTVWPAGTAAARPFRVEDGMAWGPGVFDMKAGIVTAFAAIAAVAELLPEAPVTISLTPDEEVGNPCTRDRIAELARAASGVLVLEPCLIGGGLKTRRKGIAEARIGITGRAAHAGVEPHRGASAAVEAAYVALASAALADPAAGTTVNVGLLHAGGPRNVVAAHGEVVLDIRGWHEREIRRVLDGLSAMRPMVEGCTLAVEAELHRPPMERSPASASLAATVARAGRDLGLELHEGEAGGGSEANLAAAAGAAVVDGLGPDGRGAHALDERVTVESIYERAALVSGAIAYAGEEAA